MKTLFLAPLVIALAACAHMDPNGSTSRPLDVATLGAQEAPAMQWPDQQWWQRYNDPQLNALIADAVTGSPSLVTAQARLARASANASSANAALYPQANATATATRQRYTENGIVPPPLGGTIRTDARLALNLSYDFDFWNRNGSALKAALSESRAAEAETHAARNVLMSSVAASYFNLQRLFAQHAVLEDAIKQRGGVFDLTQQRFRNGIDTRVEVKQAESLLAQARADRAQVDEAIALQRNQLAALLGAGPDRVAGLQPVTLAAPSYAAPANVPLSLVGHRAEIVAARWRVEAAQRNVDVAKAAFYPDINISAFAGVSSLGFPKLLEGGSGIFGIGPAITLPIFEGGRLNANLQGRQADIDLAIASYNQAVIDAVHEVSDTLDSIRALGRQADEQRQARQATEEAYNLALQRYKAGLGNYLTVLTAQSTVLAQERLDTDLQARAFTLDVALARALGGGVALPDSLTALPPATVAATQR